MRVLREAEEFGMDSVAATASETYMHRATWLTLVFRKSALAPASYAHWRPQTGSLEKCGHN